jgi:hypothetical protein
VLLQRLFRHLRKTRFFSRGWSLLNQSVLYTIGFSIYEWSGTGPTGPALYSQVGISSQFPSGYSVFSGINLSLDPSKVYAAVFDMNQSYPAGYSLAYWNGDPLDVYTGGSLWESVLSSSQSQGWYNVPAADLMFLGEFVPEPSLLAFSLTAFLVGGLMRRRLTLKP